MNLERSAAYRRIRRIHPEFFDTSTPIGNGLAQVVEEVERLYQSDISEAINNVGWRGAYDAGYRSFQEPGEEGPTSSYDDIARWLNEPQPPLEVLLSLCRHLDIQPPSYIEYAMNAREPRKEPTMNATTKAGEYVSLYESDEGRIFIGVGDLIYHNAECLAPGSGLSIIHIAGSGHVDQLMLPFRHISEYRDEKTSDFDPPGDWIATYDPSTDPDMCAYDIMPYRMGNAGRRLFGLPLLGIQREEGNLLPVAAD